MLVGMATDSKNTVSTWRPFHPPHRPGSRFSKAVPLGVAADPALARCLKQQGPTFTRIAKDWQYIAGEAADWTLPLAVKGKAGRDPVLVIAAAQGRALILQMLIPDIIARTNTRLGYNAVARISIDQSGQAFANTD